MHNITYNPCSYAMLVQMPNVICTLTITQPDTLCPYPLRLA